MYSHVSESTDDDRELANFMDEIEKSQQTRKVQFEMVAANLMELYRNPRTSLFAELAKTAAF